MEQHGGDSSSLVFTLNTDDKVIAGTEHPVFVEYEVAGGEPAPYVHVRNSLNARISRSVFYQLAEWAEERDGVYGVVSQGCFMPLSEIERS